MTPRNPPSRTLFVLLAAAATTASAQAPTTLVPEVIVDATRAAQSEVTTPSSITVIDRAAIEASGARHLVDLLRGQGLVQMQSFFGNGSRPTLGLRGFGVNGGSNTLVLVDGRRLNNFDIAAPDLGSVALEDVEQVEIIQGSAAVLYGDQAVGGVINIVTRRVRERRADVSFTYGTDRDRDLRASASRRFANGIGVKGAVQWHDTDNYRDNNALDYHYASLRVEHDSGERRLFAEAQVARERLGLPGQLSRAEVAADRRQTTKPDDFAETDNAVARIGLGQSLGEAWRFEAELAYRRGESDGGQNLFGLLTGIEQQRRHLAFTPRLVGSLPFRGNDALLIAGIDYNRTRYDIDSASPPFTRFIQEADQELLAGYLQFTVPIGDTVTATLGARHERMDGSIDEYNEFFGPPTTQAIDETREATAFEAGISWQVAEAWRLFARVDTPFRFAKVDENAYTSFGTGTLEVQTGRSFETGFEWQGSRWQFKTLLYRLDIDDEIGYDPTALDPFNSGNFGANVNFDQTRRDGLLLEGRAALSETLLISGQWSWIDATFRSAPYRGERMPMVAPRSGRVALEWTPSSAWRLFVETVYTGPRRLDGDFTGAWRELGGHTLLNAHLSYHSGPWSLSLRGDNLAGKEYSDYGLPAYDAGFNLVDHYYPAPERRLFLGLQYRME